MANWLLLAASGYISHSVLFNELPHCSIVDDNESRVIYKGYRRKKVRYVVSALLGNYISMRKNIA